MAASPEELIERFRADYARLLTPAEPPEHRIALAVSGGPDSVAMLGLAAAAFPGRVMAATVDHGLRPESAAEAGLVARTCARFGAPHAVLAIPEPPGESGNLHAWARRWRYRLLGRWAATAGAATLCTAHHADDQAETFLMRAARASGLSGLAGVRPRHDMAAGNGESGGFAGALLRPLLGWRRSDLRSFADHMDLAFVDDPSNRDPRFDRSRTRQWLENAPWIDPESIARSALNVASVHAELQDYVAALWRKRAFAEGDNALRIDVEDLPRFLRRDLARLAIARIRRENDPCDDLDAPASRTIEALLDALETGGAATQSGVMASAKGTHWRFYMAPPRRSR